MRELEQKRTRTSKTYDLGGGQYRTEIGQLPMHYERDGCWHEIDLTPRWDEARGHFVVSECPYVLRVGPQPDYVYNAKNGRRVEVRLMANTPFPPVAEGGLVKWAEVGRDTDYLIQPLPNGCATLLILNGPEAPRRWSWRINGDIGAIKPLVGHDAAGRRLELNERRDAESGLIEVDWTGRTLARQALRRERRVSWTHDVTWPVAIDPTVNENVAAGSDDARSTWIGSGATFYAFYNSTTAVQAGRYLSGRFYAGVRFQTIAVPIGATINTASLTVRVLLIQGSPNINIFGNDIDDAATWNNPANRIRNISKTTAVTNKSSWTGGADNSIDVAAIVAEIIARGGWASNNDIAFGFFDNGSGTDLSRVSFAALEHATLTEARLSIDYTAAGGGGAAAVIVGRGLTASRFLNPRSLVRH